MVNETGPDGNIDYEYGNDLQPLESLSSGFNYFHHFDDLGSVVNLTDANGSVQESYTYDTWGNALAATGNVGTQNKFRFTGQALDPTTGLYYFRARYYDQTSGRFLSRDPFAGFARFPMTLNRYPYVGNNPTNFIDQSGFTNWNPNPGHIQPAPLYWALALGVCLSAPEFCVAAAEVTGITYVCSNDPGGCGQFVYCIFNPNDPQCPTPGKPFGDLPSPPSTSSSSSCSQSSQKKNSPSSLPTPPASMQPPFSPAPTPAPGPAPAPTLEVP